MPPQAQEAGNAGGGTLTSPQRNTLSRGPRGQRGLLGNLTDFLGLTGTEGRTPFQDITDLLSGRTPEQQARIDRLGEVGEQFQTGLQEVKDKAGTAVETVAAEDAAKAEFEAGQEEEREEIEGLVKAGQLSTDQDIGQTQEALENSRLQFNEKIDRAGDALAGLPDSVRNEFRGIRDEFRTVVSGAISSQQADRDAALGRVFQGQALAMDSAVQGMQGQVNSQIAQINSNPNLTDAQRQQMTSQVRLQGAMQIGPAIGATQLQFNQLAAQVSTQFGSIIGGIQTAGISGEVALGTAAGNAFAQTSVAVGQLGNQLLGIEANADNAFAATSGQLIATREQARNTGNQILMGLNDMGEFVPFSNAALLDVQFSSDILERQFRAELGVDAAEASAMAAAALEGNGFIDLLETGAEIAGSFFGLGG